MTQGATGLTFKVDTEKCTGCGECAADCVAEVIEMRDKLPLVPEDRAESCIGCQHCLAVCPTGAASVLGLDPAASAVRGGAAVDADALSDLVRMRRSCRRFSEKPVDPALIDKLVDLIAYAPTGVNNMARRFTVIRDKAAMDVFRKTAVDRILEADERGGIPAELDWIAESAREWRKSGKDEIFRGAPHLLLVSNPKDAPCGEQDCLIALSYFDILANAHGLGTVWAGIPYWVVKSAAPALRDTLGLPADHEHFYVMLFGNPAVAYARSVQREPENVHMIPPR